MPFTGCPQLKKKHQCTGRLYSKRVYKDTGNNFPRFSLNIRNKIVADNMPVYKRYLMSRQNQIEYKKGHKSQSAGLDKKQYKKKSKERIHTHIYRRKPCYA